MRMELHQRLGQADNKHNNNNNNNNNNTNNSHTTNNHMNINTKSNERVELHLRLVQGHVVAAQVLRRVGLGLLTNNTTK